MLFYTALQDTRPAARICLDLLRGSDKAATRRLMNLANHSQGTGASNLLGGGSTTADSDLSPYRTLVDDDNRLLCRPNRLEEPQSESLPPLSEFRVTDYALTQVFREIYDARARYTAKPDMQTLPLADLSIGDLVLVECWFVRSRINRDSSAWDTWNAAFQLRSVSLLLSRTSFAGPSAPHIDADDGFDGYI